VIAPADRKRDIVLVYGKTGTGKTRWTRAFLRPLRRVLILDPLGEYDCPRFDELDPLIDFVARNRVFRVATERSDALNVLCALALAAQDCWLVIEEAQRALPPMAPPPSYFTHAVYRGRHARLSMLMVSQRPTTVNIVARSQWTRIVTFNQSEKNDVAWVLSQAGAELDPASLPLGYYYDIRPAGTVRAVLRDGLPVGHDDSIRQASASVQAGAPDPGTDADGRQRGASGGAAQAQPHASVSAPEPVRA
jgi:hypothetical protein